MISRSKAGMAQQAPTSPGKGEVAREAGGRGSR